MKTVSKPGESAIDTLVSLLVEICETPAPTFEEGERAKLVCDLLTKLGLEPSLDAVGNVVACLPGGKGPRVLLAAHLDTVFSRDIEIKVKSKGNRLSAPGIGDNSASLAVLIYFIEKALTEKLVYPNLLIAATVGEEGLGDLYGVRELIKHYRDDIDMMIAVDGHLGTIVDEGVGSIRFEVKFHAKGGHSWGDYPSPSAVHALAHVVYALNKLFIPRQPRSSLNVGQINGGTSVNAIAQDAYFNLDLRSVDADVLVHLEKEAIQLITKIASQHEVSCSIDRVGRRPAGQSENKKLVQAAKKSLKAVGVRSHVAASSTDANIAMAAGIPAIGFGVYHGGDAHRLSEWLEPKSLLTGYQALTDLMRTLSQTA